MQIAKIVSPCVGTKALVDDAVTVSKIGHPSNGPALLAASDSNVPSWENPANYPAMPMFKASTAGVTFPKISGDSFPGSPAEGQNFKHDTHRWSYYYDGTAGGWLGHAVHEIDAGDTTDVATGVYLRYYGGGLSAIRFTATVGHKFNFAVKVVGIYVQCAAAQANSCTVEVTDDGSAVSGGSLALVASDTEKYDEAMMSTTIAARSVIGVRVTGTGPLEGPPYVRVRFRRFET